MNICNFFYGFLAMCLQLIPGILCGQSLNDSISSTLSVDSLTATSQGDTICYLKRNFFDFGEIYKKQDQSAAFSINSVSSEPISVQNTAFSIEDDIDMTKYVGQIPYTHNVTSTGGKSYTIPLEIAVANGITPQIAMVYNSQNGNGLLGVGWNLSGLSAITVTNKNIYFDNEVAAPISGDSDLVFVLDGVRLVSSHKLEEYSLETFQGQILVQPVYSDQYNTVVKYFRVLYPNGTKAIFGFDTDKSETEYTYPIVSLEDIKGYRVDFEYIHSSKEVDVISKVRYGSRDSNSHPSWIEFEYMDRNDIPTAFILGKNVRLGKLLTKIKSYNDNQELRTYTLTYDLNDVYQLVKIDCSVGNSSLNPLQFRYGNRGDSVVSDELIKRDQMLLSTYFSSTRNMIYQRGRFNKNDYNEGLIIYPNFSNYGLLLTDKFWTPAGSVYSYQYGSTYSPDQALLIVPKLSSLSDVRTIYAGEGFQQLASADVDGDGIDELIQLNIIGFYSNEYCALKVTTHKCTPTGFSSDYKMYAVDGLVVDGPYTSPIARSYYFGDFNGDGKIDLLTISCNSSFKGDMRTSIFTVIDLSSGDILSSYPCFSYGSDNLGYVYTLDYDGDGKSDICHVGVNNTDIYSLEKQSNGLVFFQKKCSTNSLKQLDVKGREVQITDYNGDGKQDLVVLPLQSIYYNRPLRVYEFIGQGCEEGYTSMGTNNPAYSILRGNYPEDRYRILVCTTNDNSYYVEDREQTEEILYIDGGDIWELYLSKGENGFNYKSMNLDRIKQDMEYTIMDIDRDGYPDVLQSSSQTVSVYLQKGGIWESTPCTINDTFRSIPKLIPINLSNYGNSSDVILIDKETAISCSFSKNRGKNRLLTEMTDSYGLRHTNYYTEMTSQEVYRPGNMNRMYPYNDIIAPLNLLERASVYNMAESRNVFQEFYKYYGATFHRIGLGFCGFTKIEVTNGITGWMTVDEKNPELFGVSIRTTSPMIERNYVYQNNAVGKCSNLLIKSITELDKLKGDTIVTSYEYDSLGNPIKEMISFSSIIKTITEQTYDNIIMQGRYVLGMPRIKKVTQVRDKDLWVESEENSYDSRGFLIEKISKIENNQVNKTLWTYDDAGNIIQEENTPYTATKGTRQLYYYDSKKRYLSESYDELGRVVTYSSYDKYANPTSAYGYAVSISKLESDDFGRVKSMIYKDRAVSITYVWEPIIGLYSVTKEIAGSPTQKIYYDALGREVQIAIQRFDNSWQYVKKEYDNRGRLSKLSLPFKDGGSISWTTYTYDDYDRLLSVVDPSGKSVVNSYLDHSIVTTENGITKTSTFDELGLLVNVSDLSGVITYKYRADRQLQEIVAPGNIVTSFSYDKCGRRNKIVDPSAGTQTIDESYEDDKYIVVTTDANNFTTKMIYDIYGRLLKKIQPDCSFDYSYQSFSGELQEVLSLNGKLVEYSFASPSLLKMEKEYTPDGDWLQRDYTYTFGKLTKIVYSCRPKKKPLSKPAVIATEYRTYTNGHLTEIKLNDTSVWTLSEENSIGQSTKVLTGPLIRTYGYDTYGALTERKVNSLQHFTYTFDSQNGNLQSRTDKTRNMTEYFTYDDLNRLTGYDDNKSVDYDTKGNIINMSGVGSLFYNHPSKPYAVTSIASTNNLVPMRAQNITYTSFMRPDTIRENNSTAVFTYGESGNRTKMVLYRNGIVEQIRYYAGNCYEKDGEGERLYIGGDVYSAPVVYVKNNDKWGIYYVCRDYLSSITHVADSTGKLVQELSYDAWGRLRNPVDQTLYTPDNEPILFLGRGYTGHEHLSMFGLINMNARLYDPALGRFLNPDPYIQTIENGQGFNRYSYCLNNPLLYKDITGETPLPWLIPVVVGAIAGTYSGGVIANDGQFNPVKWNYSSGKTWGYMFGGAVVGGLSGYVGWAVAGTGIPMANTAGIASASLINSVGTWGYTGGQTPISINLGIASYDFTHNQWGYLGKKGNKWYENFGYSLGALANVSDVLAGLRPEQVQLQTENVTDSENIDKIGHSQLLDTDGNSLVDFGPGRSGEFYQFNKGRNNWTSYATSGRITQTKDIPNNLFTKGITIKGINLNRINAISKRLNNNPGFYNFLFRSCSSVAARALTASGAPMLGIHPYLLYAQSHMWNLGVRPWSYSYFLNQ